MKKILVIAMMFVMALTASAQVKSFDVKGDLRNDFGLGLGVTCGFNERIDFAPSFNYYFVDAGHFFTVDADVHFNTRLMATDFSFYPLAGVAVMNSGAKGVDSVTKLGVDLGAGVKYNVTNNVGLFLECKYQWFSKWDDLYLSLGVNIGI